MWMIFLASQAGAGVPVVYDGTDDSGMLAAVAAKSGLPVSQLTSTRLDALLATPPVAIGAATLRRCAGEPVPMSGVELELGRAQAAYSGGDDSSGHGQGGKHGKGTKIPRLRDGRSIEVQATRPQASLSPGAATGWRGHQCLAPEG